MLGLPFSSLMFREAKSQPSGIWAPDVIMNLMGKACTTNPDLIHRRSSNSATVKRQSSRNPFVVATS